MKRKAGLFLLTVMVFATLAATLVVSLAMYRLVSERQGEEIHKLEESLGDRFATFVVMLRAEHNRIKSHMEEVLPRIAADLDSMGRAPGDLSAAELDTLTRKYAVQNIYFIDRSHKVFQTNLPTDLGLQFPDGVFTAFLDTVYRENTVRSHGIDLSSTTGVLRTYSYFGPAGKDYVIETSTNVRDDLKRGTFGWMSKFFFEDFFTDAIRSNVYVKQVDIYLANDAGFWSLIHVGQRLAREIVEKTERQGRYESLAPDGRTLTVYSRYLSAGPTIKDDPVANKLIIRRITYDTGLALDAVFRVVTGSLVVLALTLPIVFWAASRLLQKQLLDPLLSLRDEANVIAGGNLDQAIVNTGRQDEIGNLARSFDIMRGAVRKTILDLKQTNLSIGRFVPHAFLDLIGKPSIVDVELGDNAHKDMTVLFADIRNFTTLSETMTPGENFNFINDYLKEMGPVIRDHNGFIDKYIGDAIMALFEDADDALKASLAMVDTLERFNQSRRTKGIPPIAIGIGINTGALMLGTIGEQHRMDGTVISDAVNLASRIEQLTKSYQVSVLISQFTYDRLADPHAYAIRPIDIVTVKGKSNAVTIFELFERNDAREREAKAQTRDLLWRGVEALHRNDKAAARCFFEQSLAARPNDRAAINFLQYCA
ncbi:MAG: adenylate/guanylate cyclase domain-containing protein [Proteobacteria bacterium]|nr:adenylate/guanylate cyclase domain-containing protein [Pseudomonadota bacterium]